MLSSRKRTKDKPKKWGDPDRAKLLYLIDTGKVDIESSGALELDNVKFVYNKYFGEHKYKNFAKNFRIFASDYALGEEFDGARLQEYCESCYVLLLILIPLRVTHLVFQIGTTR